MKFIRYIKENYLLLLILLLATFLRLYQLDFQGVWLDEVHTMIESCPELTIAEFKEVITFREGMGYLYFFIVRIFQEVLGISSYSVRLFSAIIGIAAVYSIYSLGKSLYNKNVGLIAALLLSVNSFIIFYSQEARPYMLLVFAVILSFKLLVDFIRKPTYKTSIYYGLSTGLIVNAHFVGLSTLFSQYVLLLFIFILIDKKQKLNFFKYGAISFFVTLLLSWNTKDIFIKLLDYKSGWLTLPGKDGFTIIFYDLLGSTEMVTFIFSSLIVFFLIKIFNEKELTYKHDEIINNRLIFTSLVLFSWFFLPILIPIIKSYTTEPMIYNRYFICLIPALLITIAIGLELIKNKISKILIIAVVVLFALTDLFLVKDYYHRINKTQFKEIADKVREKNVSKSKIYSSWGWHFQYYFNRDKKNKMTVIDKPMPFQSFVNELMTNPEVQPFWYIAAHFQPYSLTPESERFLSDHYNVVENVEYFDTWAKYYVPKPDANDIVFLDINKFSPVKSDNSVNILLFSNSTTKSEPVTLEPGEYRLAIKAKSLPDPPLQGQNANIAIAISGGEIGSYFLNEKEEATNYFPFSIKSKKDVTVDLTFGNDLVIGQADRNALVFSVSIEKVKK
jgi:hypothetical protein